MSANNRTLWMGNIENWMSYDYLYDLLREGEIFPKGIIIKNYTNKRGCAFLEFFSHEQAKETLEKCNGKIVNGIQLIFNWVYSFEQKFPSSKIKKFTVSNSKSIFFINFNKQLFVGNIDKSISFEEVKKYFIDKYSSIISAKLITNPQTKKSKGYAFIEFTNYKEFNDALNTKEPLIFGNQKLVLNSAKNKFNIEEENKNFQIEENLYFKDTKILDSPTLFTPHNSLSSSETGISSIRTSKKSNFSCNDNGEKNTYISDNNINKTDINKESNDVMDLEIKDSLKKFSTYYNINQNNNNSLLFNYYYSSFLDNSYYNNKNLSISNKYNNFDENNNNNYNRNISFEPYKNSY